MNQQETFDIAIIGGGINGCGIARDAAGRDYSVCLLEMGDLGQATSSSSTKLVHGGLRYLEYYKFKLVREALKEREVLWSLAPHIIWPLHFVLPYHKSLRPFWMLRLGLFIYDHLGGRKLLAASKTITASNRKIFSPLIAEFQKGFEYSDCGVDDARLVILNARDAAAKGAKILPRTKVTAAERKNGLWHITTQAVHLNGSKSTKPSLLKAKLLINAAGPWADAALSNVIKSKQHKRYTKLVKGSHILVPKLFDHDRCYLFQNPDGRITFAIPYQTNFTLIGTTDVEYHNDPSLCHISDDEIDYLCQSINKYFKKKIKPEDVVWSYSAIRPLFDDGASKAQEATRDYVIKIDQHDDGAPLINIFGGKITTYRKLAETVLEKADKLLKLKSKAWTADSPLPGGDFPVTKFESQIKKLVKNYKFLKPDHARRLMQLYGTVAYQILGTAKSTRDLGIHFGGNLYEAEVEFLIEKEWALTPEDIIWRRTKLGLILTPPEVQNLTEYFNRRQ